MSGLEIGIPIYNNLTDAKDSVERALRLPGVTRVHLSVNSPEGFGEAFTRLTELDSRIQVTLQPSNLGLYGNLRYLINHAEAPYFSWQAADDLISADFVTSFFAAEGEAGLTVCNFVHQNCTRIPNIVWDESSTSPGWWPESAPRMNPTYFSSEPSWIFGIWSTHYLRTIFPKSDFDFLDTVLLAKALVQNEIRMLSVQKPSVIGLWEGRPPNHVNGKYHRFLGWLLHSLALVLREKPLSFLAWKSFVGALSGRVEMSVRTRITYLRTLRISRK